LGFDRPVLLVDEAVHITGTAKRVFLKTDPTALDIQIRRRPLDAAVAAPILVSHSHPNLRRFNNAKPLIPNIPLMTVGAKPLIPNILLMTVGAGESKLLAGCIACPRSLGQAGQGV
jgi:hypothetical protein